jgi:AcrR family transcriptional regulator
LCYFAAVEIIFLVRLVKIRKGCANPGSEHPEHNEESSLKEKIFQSAIALFAEYGLNGARMEQIAEKAGTTKRMVVYHFKNKENLYLLVLEHVYTQIRASEKALSLAECPRSKRWSTWLKPPLTIMPTTGLHPYHLHGKHAARPLYAAVELSAPG